MPSRCQQRADSRDAGLIAPASRRRLERLYRITSRTSGWTAMPTRRWAAARGIPGRSRCSRLHGRSGGPGLGAQRMRPSACGAFRPVRVTSQRVSACHHRAAAADRGRCIAIRFDPLLRQTGFVPVGWRDCRDALQQRCVVREYDIQVLLGHGGAGIVYKACNKKLDQVVTARSTCHRNTRYAKA